MSKFPPRITKVLFRFHSKYAQRRLPSNSTSPFAQIRGFSSPITNRFSHYSASGYKTQNSLCFQGLISRSMFSSGVSGSKFNAPSSFLGVSCRNYLSAGSKSRSFSSYSSDSRKLLFNPLGIRRFSVKNSGFGSIVEGGFARKAIEKPLAAFSRCREAVGLQIEGFLKRNYLFLVGAGGVLVCVILWRIMFGIANTFVSLSEGMAKYGFLALSSAMVAITGLYIRARYTINPDKVYRIAMRKLNTSAGTLEVMGAPLTGTDLRAYVMSGGGVSMRKLKPRLRSKRCFIIFPIQGSEKKGLVSVEVKKKKGQYDLKLLAVDVPMASGPDQRLFLIGDEEEYRVGGGLISELRDPVVKAMAATKEFESLDQIEEEEDAERELLNAEAKQREEIERLESEKAH